MTTYLKDDFSRLGGGPLLDSDNGIVPAGIGNAGIYDSITNLQVGTRPWDAFGMVWVLAGGSPETLFYDIATQITPTKIVYPGLTTPPPEPHVLRYTGIVVPTATGDHTITLSGVLTHSSNFLEILGPVFRMSDHNNFWHVSIAKTANPSVSTYTIYKVIDGQFNQVTTGTPTGAQAFSNTLIVECIGDTINLYNQTMTLITSLIDSYNDSAQYTGGIFWIEQIATNDGISFMQIDPCNSLSKGFVFGGISG